MLDVGYAFAEPAHLAGLLALCVAEPTSVDLAEAEVPGLRSIVAGVRDLPFGDGAFELAHWISTLEHVGRGNTVYSVDAPQAAGGDEVALRDARHRDAPRRSTRS